MGTRPTAYAASAGARAINCGDEPTIRTAGIQPRPDTQEQQAASATPDDCRRHTIGEVANGVASEPQVGLAVAAGIQKVLSKEGSP